MNLYLRGGQCSKIKRRRPLLAFGMGAGEMSMIPMSWFRYVSFCLITLGQQLSLQSYDNVIFTLTIVFYGSPQIFRIIHSTASKRNTTTRIGSEDKSSNLVASVSFTGSFHSGFKCKPPFMNSAGVRNSPPVTDDNCLRN